MKQSRIFTNKTLQIAGGTLLTVILFGIYLYAMTRPGLWHGDTFLYQQKDGSFTGSDYYFAYAMTRTDAEDGTDITFAVDDKTHRYHVAFHDQGYGNDVQIYEDNTLIFDGYHNPGWLLMPKEGFPDFAVSVTTSNQIPTAEESFPSYHVLYKWADLEQTQIRGTAAFIIPILFLAAYILIDIRYPEFFFHLRYAFAWDLQHAEPSDWYYTGQRIGRVLCAIAIVACIIMTFCVRA